MEDIFNPNQNEDQDQDQPEEPQIILADIILKAYPRPRRSDRISLRSSVEIADSISDHLGFPVPPDKVYATMANLDWPTQTVDGEIYWKVTLE